MSTRSLICYSNDKYNYNISSIYCHSDGYLSYVGKLLFKHYQDPAKVQSLVVLGNLSSLGSEIGERHDFSEYSESYCTAYGRDRGETDQQAMIVKGKKELLRIAPGCDAEHIYLFSNGYWSWYDVRNGKRWRKLTKALVAA